VGVGGDLIDLVEGEVLGLGAGGELLETEVNGIGPEVKGGQRRVGAAGGGEQLDGTEVVAADRRDRGGGPGRDLAVGALRVERHGSTPAVPFGGSGRLGGGHHQRQAEEGSLFLQAFAHGRLGLPVAAGRGQ